MCSEVILNFSYVLLKKLGGFTAECSNLKFPPHVMESAAHKS